MKHSEKKALKALKNGFTLDDWEGFDEEVKKIC